MANRLEMAMIQALVALFQRGWSQRRIARELGIDRETVARYAQQLRAAEAKPAIVHTGSEGADPLLAGLLPPDLAGLGKTSSVLGRLSECAPFRELIRASWTRACPPSASGKTCAASMASRDCLGSG